MSDKDQTQASKKDDTITSSLGEALPENVNDVELGAEDQKGLLSFIGDPIGKGLENILNPLGSLIGGTGDRMAGVTKQDETKKESGGDGGYEKFGGKEQNGGNPLGL